MPSPVRSIPVLATAALLALGAQISIARPSQAQGSEPVDKAACTVLTAKEVSAAVGAALAVDPNQSGPDGGNRENCVWTLKNGPSVTLQIERQHVPSTADLAFTKQATIAFGQFPLPGKPSPEPVSGLGDHSLYRDFDGTVKGGAVVVRKGGYIWNMSGDVSKNALMALAKLVGGRL